MKLNVQSMNEQNIYDVIALLPAQIAELSEIIGLSATLALVDKFGGLSFEMPYQLDSKNGQWLVRELGEVIAQKLINHCKGERLYINNCDALRVYLRNQAIACAVLAKMETGLSRHRAIQETAPEFGITERRAYVILGQMTKVKPQLNLFD